jgi:hypothetical protein
MGLGVHVIQYIFASILQKSPVSFFRVEEPIYTAPQDNKFLDVPICYLDSRFTFSLCLTN